MTGNQKAHPDLQAIPMLRHETLYVGVDIGKKTHVAGFISTTLLSRHQRFEQCPALAFENSREGFRSLIDRIKAYVPLTQVQVLLEVTGHYHRALLQYLQELAIPVFVIHGLQATSGSAQIRQTGCGSAWPTNCTINERKASRSAIPCKRCAAWFLPAKLPPPFGGWYNITMNWWRRVPSVKTS
jgi:hypothetical protein